MTFISEARAQTPNARKYALQLGKHWQHNLHVEVDGDARRITFPRDARGASWAEDALVTLQPDEGALVCRIEASEPGQMEGLKRAVERHVDRFAFREGGLSYDWKSPDDSGGDRLE